MSQGIQESIEAIAYRGYIFHPPETVFSDVGVDSLQDREALCERLAQNVYYKFFSPERREDLIRRVQALDGIGDYLIGEVVQLPNVVTVSVYGGYPFKEKRVPFTDVDINIVVPGSAFQYVPDEDHTISKGNPIYDRIRAIYEGNESLLKDKLGISILIVGKDNMVHGTPVGDTIEGSSKHLHVVSTKVVSCWRRDIVLAGRQYAVRTGDERNVVTQCADLLLGAYKRIYAVLDKPESPQLRENRTIARLVEVNLFLKDINPTLTFDEEEMLSHSIEHIHGRFSSQQIEELFHTTIDMLFETDRVFS